MRFGFDPGKRRENLTKHGVDCVAAARAFQDPFQLVWEDVRYYYEELRWCMLGAVEGRVLLVAFTLRSDAVWIISARKATSRNRSAMGEQSAAIRLIQVNDRLYEEREDGALVPVQDDSDWPRVDALSDEDIISAAQDDPGSMPLGDAEWARARLTPPGQVLVELALDRAVARWIRSEEAPRDLSAILREHMAQNRTTER